jgi:ribA/ribD-fused uncharacterized protein
MTFEADKGVTNDWGVFFWKPPHPFCNWTNSRFEYDNVVYNCPEQAIVHQKALLFADKETAEDIMKCSNAKKQKALGRKVRGFDQDKWLSHISSVLPEILYAKFSQNDELKKDILATGTKMLFEASI